MGESNGEKRVVDKELIEAAKQGEDALRAVLRRRAEENRQKTSGSEEVWDDRKCRICNRGFRDKRMKVLGQPGKGYDVDGMTFGVDCAKRYKATKERMPDASPEDVATVAAKEWREMMAVKTAEGQLRKYGF